jgi:hypothetical protein
MSAKDPRTIRPKRIFLEKLCQKPQIFNNPQEPADCLPQGHGLSAPQQKTDFSKFTFTFENATHLNAMHARHDPSGTIKTSRQPS